MSGTPLFVTGRRRARALLEVAPVPAQRFRYAIRPAQRRPDAASAGSLATGALWLLASNIAYAATQWGALASLAKLLPATSLGHFGLALAVATPVVLVTGLALRTVQATDVDRRYRFSEYLCVRLLANLVAATVIAAVVAGGFDPAAASVLVPIAAAKLAEATSETCYGLAQRHDHMRLVGISKLTRGMLGLVAMVTVVELGGTLVHGAWALAGTWTAFLLAFDLPAASGLERVFVRPRRSASWQLIVESAPLGAMNGVFAVSQSLPRYVLAMCHGDAAVGYFTAVAALGPALDQLAASIGHAAAPRLGRAATTDPQRFHRLMVRLLGVAAAFGTPLVLAAALGGGEFLRLAYTGDYAAYRLALVLVTLAAALRLMNTMVYFALVATRRNRIQVAAHGIGLLVTGVGAVLMIPRLSVNGAAAALVLGAAAMMMVAVRGVVFGRGVQLPVEGKSSR